LILAAITELLIKRLLSGSSTTEQNTDSTVDHSTDSTVDPNNDSTPSDDTTMEPTNDSTSYLNGYGQLYQILLLHFLSYMLR
jgi:hypothetical protein